MRQKKACNHHYFNATNYDNDGSTAAVLRINVSRTVIRFCVRTIDVLLLSKSTSGPHIEADDGLYLM